MTNSTIWFNIYRRISILWLSVEVFTATIDLFIAELPKFVVEQT